MRDRQLQRAEYGVVDSVTTVNCLTVTGKLMINGSVTFAFSSTFLLV